MKTLYLKISSLLIATLLFSPSLIAQNSNDIKPYNRAMLWRGFKHKWTYNHRINRIGSSVAYEGGKALCKHYSASGLGSDSTFATTYYTYIESPNVCFKETQVKILVNGKEGDLLTKMENIYLDLDDWMLDKAQYDVVVNGFEVQSKLKSDQLQLLRFLVEDPYYLKETKQIHLKANFNLVTNCRTLECDLFKDQTGYELTLHLLIIGFDEGAGEVRNSYTTRNYVWDTAVEVEDLDKKLTILGQKEEYPTACLGIKGMGIVLNEEHWLLQINNIVTPLKYDQTSGQMDAYVNMKFLAWNHGMEHFSVQPFKAEFAKRKPGFAMLDTNPCLIQFSDAKIIHGKKKTSLFWKGRNKSSSSPEAESISNINDQLNLK